MTELIAAAIALVGTLVTAWFTYRNNKNSDKKKELLKQEEEALRKRIEETQKELIEAMENNITDVPGIRMKLETYRKQLKRLVGVVLIGLCSLPISGCLTWFQKEQPVVVGERIFYMTEGQTMVVPALRPPAKQWYLIDDVAMLKVLGIDKPIEKPVTGNTKE